MWYYTLGPCCLASDILDPIAADNCKRKKNWKPCDLAYVRCAFQWLGTVDTELSLGQFLASDSQSKRLHKEIEMEKEG